MLTQEGTKDSRELVYCAYSKAAEYSERVRELLTLTVFIRTILLAPMLDGSEILPCKLSCI